MLSFKQFLEETQKHKSPDTSLNQVSAGLKHAVSKGLITPNSVNVDNGGGKYDAGKNHVESSIEGAKLHVLDPYNRSEEHNAEVLKNTKGKSDYVGMHNVLNVIQEPEYRKEALEKVKSLMKPKTGIAHITIYQGDKSGNGRISKTNKKTGETSWQEHRPTSSYIDEVKSVFPEETHEISHKKDHIIVRQK